ncbi:IS1 family transposase [Candidatus Bandiella euplotis]|uniref:IS1 family transposase n=1 Tax=Candidatus Bandiella euplotis TaxID=1664265 RepID=UPI002B2632F7|nr:IS1 family transposase [Candidatus Bandiella woodruffii]
MAFCRFKKNKLWIWKAYSRELKRVVAWVVGKRNVTTFRKLWKIISRDNCTYYTDDWSVYSEVIPRHQHVVGKQHTLSIESNNSNTRHRIARMTRKTKVVSKSEEVVDLTIKLWVHFEDNNNFLSEQGNFISIFG